MEDEDLTTVIKAETIESETDAVENVSAFLLYQNEFAYLRKQIRDLKNQKVSKVKIKADKKEAVVDFLKGKGFSENQIKAGFIFVHLQMADDPCILASQNHRFTRIVFSFPE